MCIIILLSFYWGIAIDDNSVSHEQILEEENQIAIILDDMIKTSKLKQGNDWLYTFIIKELMFIISTDHITSVYNSENMFSQRKSVKRYVL